MARLRSLAILALGACACVCASAFASACSVLADFSGLSGSGATDGGGAVGEGGEGGVDANPIGDATPPSGLDAAASEAGLSCAQRAASVIFCADFDSADAGLSEFQVSSDHGTVTVDDTLSVSSPGSMHITQQAIANGSERNCGDLTTSSMPTIVRLDFDFDFATIGALNPNTGQSVVAIFVGQAGQQNQPTIALNVTASSLRVTEIDPTTLDGMFHDALPFSTNDAHWHHASLLLDMSATQARYALTVDGAMLDSGPTMVTFVPGLVSGEIGLGYQNPPGLDFDGHIDNIVVDTK